MPKKVSRPRVVAEGLIPKAQLAKEVARIIEDRGLTQTEAAHLIRDSPSQISLVVTGKVKGFSSERLVRMIAGLGRDVDVIIRKAKSGTGRVRLSIK
jgi:predicted XRE-type DNA-binding protein